MLAVRRVVSDQKVIELTVNCPVSVLQPRPLPEMSIPGPFPLNGYRVALRYVPGARMSPAPGTNEADQSLPSFPSTPNPAYCRPPPAPIQASPNV
jgi:hypothetical protein